MAWDTVFAGPSSYFSAGSSAFSVAVPGAPGLANSRDGVAIQVYLAIIASLLITLWVERKPTRRTLEMLQFYFTGWATEDELMAHLEKFKKQDR